MTTRRLAVAGRGIMPLMGGLAESRSRFLRSTNSSRADWYRRSQQAAPKVVTAAEAAHEQTQAAQARTAGQPLIETREA